MQKYEFHLKGQSKDQSKINRLIVVWKTTMESFKDAYPLITQSSYYKKLQLHGIDKLWEPTWIEKFNKIRTLGKKKKEDEKWAALAIVLLHELWTDIPTLTQDKYNLLMALNAASNTLFGSRKHGMALAVHTQGEIRGYINIYNEGTEYEHVSDWAKTTYIRKEWYTSRQNNYEL